MYCAWPFTNLIIYEDGEAMVCCPGWTSLTLGNVLETSPLEMWKGEKIARLRESIHDQTFRYCVDCGNPENYVQSNPPPITPNVDLISVLALSYDPTCNLVCRSCRLEPRKATDLTDKIHAAVLASGVLNHALEVILCGDGEPLASPTFWPFLSTRIEHRPELKFTLTTNGLLLTRERLEIIASSGKKIGGVSISMDAAREETYRLNRRGGNWDVLMRNLDDVKDYPFVWKQFNFVVQENNFAEMAEFLKFSLKHHATTVYFSALANWGTYSPEDYSRRAVHLPTHPRYGELVEVLTDPLFLDDRVIIAKLPIRRPGHRFDHRTSP